MKALCQSLSYKIRIDLNTAILIGTLTIACSLAMAQPDEPSQSTSPVDAAFVIDLAMQRETEMNRAPWVKTEPVLAYRVPQNVADVPRVIWDNIGNIDQLNKYQPEGEKYKGLEDFFTRVAGQYLNLAVANGQLDIYHIGNWDSKYTAVPTKSVFADNAKLISKLSAFDGMADILSEDNPQLAGGIKEAPVYLVRLSDLGIAIEEEFVLNKPEWSMVQVKPAGRDAFVNIEIGSENVDGQKRPTFKAYIINTEVAVLPGANGNTEFEDRPIAYVPLKEVPMINEPANMTQSLACQMLLSRNIHAKTGHVRAENTQTLAQALQQVMSK